MRQWILDTIDSTISTVACINNLLVLVQMQSAQRKSDISHPKLLVICNALWRKGYNLGEKTLQSKAFCDSETILYNRKLYLKRFFPFKIIKPNLFTVKLKSK